MRTRRSAFAAFAALAAMLFAQAAIAAAAWNSAPSPCHEEAPPANYCFEHCAHNDLTLDKPRLQVPELVVAPAPVTERTTPRYPQVAPLRIVVLPAGPPPRILFQSFLV